MMPVVQNCQVWIYNTCSKQFHHPQLLTHELMDSIKKDREPLGLSVTSVINPYSSSIKVFWQIFIYFLFFYITPFSKVYKTNVLSEILCQT